MNLILLSISNDIYNSVDAYTSAKDMWKRVERLMRGTIQNKVDRETRFTNEFDQFVAKPVEALVSVYNRFAQLMNDLERNDMHFPIITTNTKFLNSLQPEWLKYATQVRLAKRLTVDTFDDLFDYLQQFEKLDDIQTNSEDPLTSAINSGSAGRNYRRAYIQKKVVKGANETGNVQRTLRISSSDNTSTVQCYNYSGKGHYARNFEEDQTLKDVEKAEKEIIPQHNDDPIDLDPVPLKHFDLQFEDDIQNDEEQGADDADAQKQPNLDEDVHPELPVPMPPFVPIRRYTI
nr:hypothetical protein [Tanacetum cinerariifolium]